MMCDIIMLESMHCVCTDHIIINVTGLYKFKGEKHDAEY